MNQETLEKCAEAVHNAWWDNKKKDGFHSPRECPESSEHDKAIGKFSKFCDKCHPDMYPYEELPENIKDYDRVTAIIGLKFSHGGSGYIEDIRDLVEKYNTNAEESRKTFNGDTNSIEYYEMIFNTGITVGLELALKEFDKIFGE